MKRPRVSEILQRQLLDQFASGAYKDGEQLPTEPQLAEMFNVSRTSVREALQSLRNLGLIEIHHGKGAYLKGASPSDVVKPSVIAAFMSPLTALDLFEARGTVEPSLAAFAARRSSAADLLAVHAFMDDYRSALNTDRVSILSATFHLHVARLAHSPVLARFVESLLEMLASRGELIEGQKEYLQWEFDSHAEVLATIESRDATRAANTMMEHLVTSTNKYLTASSSAALASDVQWQGTVTLRDKYVTVPSPRD